ncbi:hypothetical protein [Sneathiella sp.]|uniref:hypothetical protein n=1 Tax=Sneathiella sp. TaxID=1964365 RepID=UPI002FE082E4
MIKFAALLAALMLSACAGVTANNPQGFAGINKAEISFNPDGSPAHALILGGKEQEEILLTVETPAGLKVDYAATGIKSFDGQMIRAAVEQAVSADVREAIPGIVDGLTSALTRVLLLR